MRDAVFGTWAMVLVTLREAQRQRLWVLIALACGFMLILIPNAGAVDETARLKLAVAAISGASGFVITLLGALLGAAAVRRDLDARIGFMLFSKPLARASYLVGRWLGVISGLLLAVVGLVIFGAASTWLQLGELPAPRQVVQADTTWRLENGQAIGVPATQPTILLSGNPLLGQGEGLRWQFDDVPPLADTDGTYDFLVRASVSGLSGQARIMISAVDSEDGHAQALEWVSSGTAGGDRWEEQRLHGRQVFLQNRDRNRTDLNQDYARFVVPAELNRDGRIVIQLNRLNADSRMQFDPGSIYLAVGGGSFLGNMVRAELVLLAQAALLAAVTICMATVAKIGTALLAALTLYFGGSTLGFIEEGMQWEQFSHVAERVLNILLTVLPDFGRYPVEASLAASQEVAWMTVMDAWSYYGVYAAVFLVLAWISLRKAEL